MRKKSQKTIESVYRPVRHNHEAFLAKAHAREGFAEAYETLAPEYLFVNQTLKALELTRKA
jgi:ssDNA-specific exonuclease RecJ